MTKSTIILPSERYERYEKKIAEKDAIIEKITSEKDAHLAEKDALIAELRAQIAEMKKEKE